MVVMACSVSSQAQALGAMPFMRDGSSCGLPSISARSGREITAGRTGFGGKSCSIEYRMITRGQRHRQDLECRRCCKFTALRGMGGVLRTGWESEPSWRISVAADSSEGTPDESSGAAVAVEEPDESPSQEVEEEELGEDEQEGSLSPEEEQDRRDIQEILGVVERLRTTRDMTFSEVRLTIVIEDPREVERRKMLNIEDERGCSKEEMGDALVEVYEGRVPQDRTTLRALADEMRNWPNLEDEFDSPSRSSLVASPYAKATDTGVNPKVAADRANVDWDSASEIKPGDPKEQEKVVPPVVGFSFLYLVSALPIIIGITVVVILFLNSLQ